MSNDHLANEQLQLFVDDALPADEAVRVKYHLESCARCKRAFESLSALDLSLRAIPVERLSKEFTRNVLVKLNIVPKTPFLFRVVENLAYVFGLMIVLGVMLSVFAVTGVISNQQIVETQSRLSVAKKIVEENVEALASGLTTTLQTYLPFVFGGGSLRLAVMGTLAVGLLALFDRFLKRRFGT